jgi:hypothetical protein
VQLLVNNQVIAPGPVDLGTWNLHKTQIINLYLKNQGPAKGIVQLPELPTPLTLAYNNCTEGRELNPQETCLMKVVTIAPSKGVLSSNIMVQGQSFQLQATVREPGDKIYCPMDHALESYITWNGQSYSPCLIESCQITHHLVDNQCAANTINCVIDNGTGAQT